MKKENCLNGGLFIAYEIGASATLFLYVHNNIFWNEIMLCGNKRKGDYKR